ncbi:MAG: thiopurine S-methyltransferase [Myxococcales bacterium]|nr:thiopurine S-methyltransferase [Myxococcales bacterium]
MEQEFWIERYRTHRIGFHQPDGNPFLRRFADRFPPGSRVLVPLCGKTPDLKFLADRGHEVVGVEFVESAAKAFFQEQGLTAEERTTSVGKVYSSGSIQIFVQDFFHASREELGDVRAVYDRASMIALPPHDRIHYATHLRRLLPRDGLILLILLSFGKERLSGPPFSVTMDEVERHYGDAAIEVLESHVEHAEAPHLEDHQEEVRANVLLISNAGPSA